MSDVEGVRLDGGYQVDVFDIGFCASEFTLFNTGPYQVATKHNRRTCTVGTVSTNHFVHVSSSTSPRKTFIFQMEAPSIKSVSNTVSYQTMLRSNMLILSWTMIPTAATPDWFIRLGEIRDVLLHEAGIGCTWREAFCTNLPRESSMIASHTERPNADQINIGIPSPTVRDFSALALLHHHVQQKRKRPR